MKRTITKHVYIPLFANASELTRAEIKKSQLENDGYELIHSAVCCLTYQKTWEV